MGPVVSSRGPTTAIVIVCATDHFSFEMMRSSGCVKHLYEGIFQRCPANVTNCVGRVVTQNVRKLKNLTEKTRKK